MVEYAWLARFQTVAMKGSPFCMDVRFRAADRASALDHLIDQFDCWNLLKLEKEEVFSGK